MSGRPLSGSDRWTMVVLAMVLFTSGADMLVMTPILPQLAAELSVDVPSAGLWVTAYAGATAFFALVFGPISDRYGRRKVLLAGMGVLTLGTLACSAAVSFFGLLLARIFAGAGAGMLVTSTTSFAGDHFEVENRAVVMGHVMNGFFLSLILAVPIGAGLTAALGWSRMFLVLSAFAGLVTLALVFGIPEPRHEVRSTGLSLGTALGGYGALLKDKNVIGVLVMSTAIGLSMTMYSVYTSPWMAQTYGLGTGDRGLVYAVGGPAIFLGGPLAGRLSDRFGRVKVILAASLLMGAMQLLMPTSQWWSTALEARLVGLDLPHFGARIWPAAIPPMAVFFFAMVAGASRSGPYQTLALEVVSPERRGALAAIRNACNQGGNGLGAALGGLIWAAPGGGYTAICLLAALITVAGAFALRALVTAD